MPEALVKICIWPDKSKAVFTRAVVTLEVRDRDELIAALPVALADLTKEITPKVHKLKLRRTFEPGTPHRARYNLHET